MSEKISRAEAIRMARANRARVEAAIRREVERDADPDYQSVDALRCYIQDLEAAADLHASAMDRARALYQAAHPGADDRWPDGAVNVAWLVARVDELEVQLAEKVRVLDVAQFHMAEDLRRATNANEMSGRMLDRITAMTAEAREEGWDAGAVDALRWVFSDGHVEWDPADDEIARYREWHDHAKKEV